MSQKPPPPQWQWQPNPPAPPPGSKGRNAAIAVLVVVLVLLVFGGHQADAWVAEHKSDKRCIEPTQSQIDLVAHDIVRGLTLANGIAIDSYDGAGQLKATRFGANLGTEFAEWKIDYDLDKVYPLNERAAQMMTNGETEMPEIFNLFDAGNSTMLQKCVSNRGQWYHWLLGP